MKMQPQKAEVETPTAPGKPAHSIASKPPMTESEFLASLPEEDRGPIIAFFQVRDAIAHARPCDWSLLCKIEPWRGCSCRSAASDAIDAWESANGRDPPGFMNDDEDWDANPGLGG